MIKCPYGSFSSTLKINRLQKIKWESQSLMLLFTLTFNIIFIKNDCLFDLLHYWKLLLLLALYQVG